MVHKIQQDRERKGRWWNVVAYWSFYLKNREVCFLRAMFEPGTFRASLPVVISEVNLSPYQPHCSTGQSFRDILKYHNIRKSCDSSVCIVLGYGLDDQSSRVWFPAGAGNFSLRHRVQNGSGAHPASYTMCTRGSFPGGKAAWAWSWSLTSIQYQGQRMSGAIPPLPHYAFTAWCSVKAQGQLYRSTPGWRKEV
jgi:hypothetical protein